MTTGTVREYWERQSCETENATAPKFSANYFQQIEEYRYKTQPFIHSFAQFTRWRGKKVLEVGYGAGTDLIQFARAGADIFGIDVTDEAFQNLNAANKATGIGEVRIFTGDAEWLPWPSRTFDLGYSYGTLHHCDNTAKAVKELARVVKPGGQVKVMLYNRHSVNVAMLCARHFCLPKTALARHQESPDTKAFTKREAARLMSEAELTDLHIENAAMNGAPMRKLIEYFGLGFYWLITANKL